MRQKKWQLSTILLLLAGIGLIVAALAILIPTVWDNQESNNTYAMLHQKYVRLDNPPQETQNAEEEWWYRSVQIDFDELKAVNPDIVGWISFDNIETIRYPVLYSGDDTTYLRTNIYGEHATAGCIFIEGENQPDLSDYHTIIYGHNMRNETMFGQLKNYKEEGFYEENQYFTIYREGLAYRYRIFAYRDVPETHSVYTVGFSPNETYRKFLEEIQENSYLDTGIAVTEEDKIVTLSTCSTTGNRFVVHAVLEEIHELEAEDDGRK